MNIVLDTNALLVAISRRSRLHGVWTALENGTYTMFVTQDMLHEYEEVIGQHMGQSAAQFVMKGLHLFSNVHLIQKYYRWKLILADPDDDKFVDCAIAANSDFLVTNDHHFDVLKTISFPSVATISVEEFANMLAH